MILRLCILMFLPFTSYIFGNMMKILSASEIGKVNKNGNLSELIDLIKLKMLSYTIEETKEIIS